MRSFAAVLLLVASASAQKYAQPEVYGPPTPYTYGYSTQDVEGSSSAEESSDGNGRVTGKYTIALADGRQRTVSYYADETGFHADVVTNELGTESKNPADVTIQSSAPTGPEAAFAFESQRVKARSSFAAPVYLPAPAAQGFAALRPVQGAFYKRRA